MEEEEEAAGDEHNEEEEKKEEEETDEENIAGDNSMTRSRRWSRMRNRKSWRKQDTTA